MNRFKSRCSCGFSPADRCFSARTWRKRLGWLFLWRCCGLRIFWSPCRPPRGRLGQQGGRSQSLLTQHLLQQKHTVANANKNTFLQPGHFYFMYSSQIVLIQLCTKPKCKENGSDNNDQMMYPCNVRVTPKLKLPLYLKQNKPSPSMKTAFRTANTAPTTILF